MRPLLSGAEFVSRIPPMKRILCLCPVPTTNESRHEGYGVGVAVSDPYLAHALPIIDPTSVDGSLRLNSSLGAASIDRRYPVVWKGIRSREEFLRQIGHRDIGGLLLALPMRAAGQTRTELDEAELRVARDSLRSFLDDLEDEGVDSHNDSSARPNEFDLQCTIDDNLTIEDARKIAREEPEMWEMIDLQQQCDDDDGETACVPNEVGALAPSVHAAAALNSFLWQTTGGWRNTFA